MPCNNVTELIRISLDHEDRLRKYEFVKKTCGRGVGTNSLLLEPMRGLSVEDILTIDPEVFLETLPEPDSIAEFLHLKHLFAIQATLQVLTGGAAGGKGCACTVSEVVYDASEVTIDAEIDVDIVTDRIKSCLACKGG